jgi:DeoR family transcriptional regulator, aga operon transcriptional repressor
MLDPRSSRVLGPDRRQQILAIIHQEGSAQVDRLSEEFAVSRVTIRSDLDWLAEQQLVNRARGGAVALPTQAVAAAFTQRSSTNRDEKQRIAKAALSFFHPNETVILDAGSTVYELSRLISNGADSTVVTPALNVATQLVGLPALELVIVGGTLDPRTISAHGPSAEQAIHDHPAHRVFLGAHGVDDHGEVVDVSVDVARLKRAMVKSAREVILLADSSKWSCAGPVRVVELSAMHVIISDTGLPRQVRRSIKSAGVELVLV